MENKTNSALNILRILQLKKKVNLSTGSIHNKLNPESKYFDKDFPKPIRLGIGAVGWIEAEIDAWIDSRRNNRDIS